MAPATNGFYTSSPTVFLPSSNPTQYFPNAHYSEQPASALTMNAPSQDMVTDVNPASLAGRKRSRGDIHAPDDEDDVRIVANSTDTTDSMTQSARVDQASPSRRPPFPCRKSQRTDSAAAGAENNLAQLVLPQEMRNVTAEPLIDEARRLLGVSWTRMDSTEALQIGQAAYTKWIQKHYSSLTNVSVWFENSAVPGYLVEATNAYSGERGYYIFSNDLTEARLVTTEPAQLIPRLQMLPALHLAAPGGCLKAETDPITAAQNEVDGVQMAISEAVSDGPTLRGRIQDYAYPRGQSVDTYEPQGGCGAHAMELD